MCCRRGLHVPRRWQRHAVAREEAGSKTKAAAVFVCVQHLDGWTAACGGTVQKAAHMCMYSLVSEGLGLGLGLLPLGRFAGGARGWTGLGLMPGQARHAMDAPDVRMRVPWHAGPMWS